MLHVQEKECAKTQERAQHTMWCGTGVAPGDAGEMSRGKAWKAFCVPWRRLASHGELLGSSTQENVGEITLAAFGE